jgi:hypothetical protein
MRIKVRYVVIIAVAVLITVFGLNAYVTPTGGKYDEFAKCLSDKDMTMFGAYWCPHCNNQKQMFGPSFKYVKYVECDPKGDNANPQLCTENGIDGYPTWIYGDNRLPGEQTLQELSSVSGCNLPT